MELHFPIKKNWTSILYFLEEAKKRDHRKLGKELELFTFSEKVGAGLPLWLPKGAMLQRKIAAIFTKSPGRSRISYR